MPENIHKSACETNFARFEGLVFIYFSQFLRLFFGISSGFFGVSSVALR